MFVEIAEKNSLGDIFEPILNRVNDPSLYQYVAAMNSDGTYGDKITLRAVSNLVIF